MSDSTNPIDSWQNGPWPELDPLKYHDQFDYVSHSRLEVFRRSIPLYQDMAKGKFKLPETGPKEFGHAFHSHILEPASAIQACRYHACSDNVGRTSKAFGTFQLNHFPDACITWDENEMLQRMSEGLKRCGPAMALLEADGITENIYRWRDPATGIWCRTKPDRIVPAGRYVIDLKTCRDPSPPAFAKDVATYGYHRQAAFYLDGLALCGFKGYQFRFVAFGKNPPYDCAVHKLNERDIYLARRDNAKQLKRMQNSIKNDDWGYRWGQEVNEISVPPWGYDWEE